ncbi:hypothetical protein AB0P17_29725 [Streptomyces sp. NPDC088124]|uniref:hypothetical protein n=1 Tax=Streptomyces sp. NPDC088124 TaxID=3154654 RepID=UPI003449A0C5
MTTHTISASQLVEGKSVLIRGKLAFAVLTRLIQGAELVASDERKSKNGMNPVGRPHVTATIVNAEVQLADPSNPTLEEQFVSERRYPSRKNPNSGPNYAIDSKGSNLPVIAIPSAAGDGTYDQDESGQELAHGLDVTLVLRVYKPKNFNNRGLALDQVIVHEKPRYYTGGIGQADLAARGIVFNGAPRPIQAAPVDAAAGDPVGTEVEDGLSFPAPQPTTEPEVMAAQVQTPVAQPTAVAAPVAAATPPPAAAPAPAPQETQEQEIARLKAKINVLKGAGSAVGAPVATGPWNGGPAEQAGITYQS